MSANSSARSGVTSVISLVSGAVAETRSAPGPRRTAPPSRSAGAPAPACACADSAPETPAETPPPRRFLPGSSAATRVHQLLAHARAHPLVVHAAVQVVRRSQIQPPQVLRLPRRQRVRMHRLNVGVGKQRQHAQRLRRLHLARERPHRLQIEDVPPQRGGHLQMVADQSQQQLALVRIQLQPPGHALRHARALPRVIVGASALAGIVQQRRPGTAAPGAARRAGSRRSAPPTRPSGRSAAVSSPCSVSISTMVCSSTV